MKKNYKYNERFQAMRANKDILIASHRGSIGVPIVDNTIASFECALAQGADILEMDIAMSADGELYVIHDGMEPRLFKIVYNVQTMTSQQIQSLEFFNLNGAPTGVHPYTLDEILEDLKDRCMINLDRCWVSSDESLKWKTIFDVVRRHGMEDQVIFKTPAAPKYAKMFADLDMPYLYMPMIEHAEDVSPFLNPEINVVAVEIKFQTDADALAQPQSHAFFHNNNIYVWGNALKLGAKHGNLAGGHDDIKAMMGDPDYGWDYYVKKGFDIVQTDYVSSLVGYYQSKGYRV